MKKILSLLLALSLVLSSAVLFSSCSRVKERDLKNEPVQTLLGATKRTFAEFFDVDKAFYRTASEATSGGSVALTLSGKRLLGDGADRITETLYFDEDGERIVADTLLAREDESASLRVFADEEGVVLVSEALFGGGDAYGIGFEDLLSRFESSALADGLSEDVRDRLKSLAMTLEKTAEEKDAEDLESIVERALRALTPVTGTEELSADGETVTATTLTYVLSRATVKEALSVLVQDLMPVGEEKAEALAEIESMYSETESFRYTLKIAIGKRSGRLLEVILEGEYTDSFDGLTKSEDWVVRNGSRLALRFGETEISVRYKGTYTVDGFTVGESTQDLSYRITKSEQNGVVTYHATAETRVGGDIVYAREGSLAYTRATGALRIETENEEGTPIAISGKLTAKEGEASLVFDSLSMNDATVSFEIRLTFRAKASIPAKPASTKDVLAMTEAELSALKARLAENIGGLLF